MPGSPDYTPEFSSDWFSKNIPVWTRALAERKGKSNLRFLEVGVFEGRSTLWVLQNILTHSSSRVICVDTFGECIGHESPARTSMQDEQIHSLYKRFLHNVSPYLDRVEIHRGISQEILRTFAMYSFDFAYIDGSHRSCDVLEDAILTFRLLKSGGIMIFDDYLWDMHRGTLDHPKAGIDAFLAAFDDQYRLVLSGYQVIIQKC